MRASTQTKAACPRIFYVEDPESPHRWIAEGTDGELYVVPAEPGGWLRRAEYRGSDDDLKCLPGAQAVTVAWLVYGDVGTITIVDG